MGKVHSIFGINGKLGDYVFYELNGQPVVRKVAEKKKNPKTEAQKIVLQQNTEFGKASAAGKALRIALATECEHLTDRYLYQRVSQLMLKLKSCDTTPHGLRTVAGGLTTKEGQYLLSSFNFHTKQKNFPQLLSAERRGGHLFLTISSDNAMNARIVELQINFETGKFRWQVHVLPETEKEDVFILKKQFRQKKGFTDIVMISGEGFLQGVVVKEY